MILKCEGGLILNILNLFEGGLVLLVYLFIFVVVV